MLLQFFPGKDSDSELCGLAKKVCVRICVYDLKASLALPVLAFDQIHLAMSMAMVLSTLGSHSSLHVDSMKSDSVFLSRSPSLLPLSLPVSFFLFFFLTHSTVDGNTVLADTHYQTTVEPACKQYKNPSLSQGKCFMRLLYLTFATVLYACFTLFHRQNNLRSPDLELNIYI